MQARKTARVPVPPRLTAEQAIPLIKGQIARLDELLRVLYSDPRIGAWENATRDILDQTYGKPDGASHPKTTEMLNAAPGPLPKKTSPAESQGKHVMRCQSRKVLLAAYIEELAQSQPEPLPSSISTAVYSPPPATNGTSHEPASMENAFRDGLSRTTAAFWEQPAPLKSNAEFLNEFRKTEPQPVAEASAPAAETPAAVETVPAKPALGPNFLAQVDRVSAALARFGASATETEASPEISHAPAFLESADQPSTGFLADVEALEAVVAESMGLASHADVSAPAQPELAQAPVAAPVEPEHELAAPAHAQQPQPAEPPLDAHATTAQVEETTTAAAAPVAAAAAAPAEVEQIEAAAVETPVAEAPALQQESAAQAEAPVMVEPVEESAPAIASQAAIASPEEIALPIELASAEEAATEDASQLVSAESFAPEAPTESAPETASEATVEAAAVPEVVEPQTAAAADPTIEPAAEHEAPAEVAGGVAPEAEHASAEAAEEIPAEPEDAAVAMPLSAAIAEPQAEVAESDTPAVDEPASAAEEHMPAAVEESAPAEVAHAGLTVLAQVSAPEVVEALAPENAVPPEAPAASEETSLAETPVPAEMLHTEAPLAAAEPAPAEAMPVELPQPVEDPAIEEALSRGLDPEFVAHLDSALGAPVSAEWAAFAAEMELRPEETPVFAATASDVAARSNGNGVAGERLLEQAALSDVCVHAVTDYECDLCSASNPLQSLWHPEIERVSGDLMRDGRWADAALASYGRVVDEVRSRSRLPMDGDSLMNHAFSCDGKSPAIAFNSLRSDAERDEQRGMMNLFKGAAGLRSARSYSEALFGDPCKAREHLALASLLMRTLDAATGPS